MAVDMEDAAPARVRKTFPGISSRAYEHPADRAALIALRKLAGFDSLLKLLNSLINEREVRLLLLGNAVQVSRQQFPRLNALLEDACRVLDQPTQPEMFVQQSPRVNAMTIGLDKPVIVLTTGLVELLDEEELRFVVAHELGHAFSGHAVYRTMLLWLMNLTKVASVLPGGVLGIQALIKALLEWYRKAEISCDRAGLLVSQDIEAAIRTHMKLAGGAHLYEMNPMVFIDQGREYESTGDFRDSLLRLSLGSQVTHPFPAVRALDLTRWVDSGAYARILTGEYPRRDDDANASAREAARDAFDSYTEGIKNSTDPLMTKVRDFMREAGAVGDRLGEKMYRKWGPQSDNDSSDEREPEDSEE
ncbi:M48 family metallopeptidase [Actinospica durhamensis]|uniref:M48 family metallopeptidase n=1 Tax=Actinospica durhamensis TaxID=1508375 RepID=A0A941EW61_9ACTN|nr:M48 family metallopeptidase [Actinospica durhamensis]MBR7839375.1 M48 family metallopeptidase [Actinospica durhamensis]